MSEISGTKRNKILLCLAATILTACGADHVQLNNQKSTLSNANVSMQGPDSPLSEPDGTGAFALFGSLRSTVRGILKGSGKCNCIPSPCRWTGIQKPVSGVVTDDRPLVIPNTPLPLTATGSQQVMVTMLTPATIASTTCSATDSEPKLSSTVVTGAISIALKSSMDFIGGCFGSGGTAMCYAFGSGSTWSLNLKVAGASITEPCGNFTAAIRANSTIAEANVSIELAAKRVYESCFGGLANRHTVPWTVIRKRYGAPPLDGLGNGDLAIPSFSPGGSYLQQTNVILGR